MASCIRLCLIFIGSASCDSGHISQLATSTPNITASKAFYEAIGFPYAGAVPESARPLLLKTSLLQKIMATLKDVSYERQAAPRVPLGQSFFQFENFQLTILRAGRWAGECQILAFLAVVCMYEISRAQSSGIKLGVRVYDHELMDTDLDIFLNHADGPCGPLR